MKIYMNTKKYIQLSLFTFIALIILFCAYIYVDKQVLISESKYRNSLLISEELRQTSDDLTRMVRSYITTGNVIYKQYFQEILDIRDGRSPRPIRINSIYWDLVIENDLRPIAFGKKISLLDLMHQEGFSKEEFAKLEEAKIASDNLTKTEFSAMKIIENSSTDEDWHKATDMLFDARYHESKAKIMEAINQFQIMVEERTLMEVQEVKRAANILLYISITLVLAIISIFLKLFSLQEKVAKQISQNLEQRTEELGHSKKLAIDLRLMKEKAEDANKAKGLFIANMSHQFRTPLNAVLGFSQLMLNDKMVADKQREYLKNIYNSGQLQLSLVNDVLAMSRLEDGQTSLQLQVIDISHLLEDLIDNSKAAAKEKKINFNVEYRSSIPQYISCDPQKLQLLLGNVIDNAIKYTESGGVVLHIESVQTESDNTVQLIFDIEDSGIGIVDKYQKHIFMPFFKIGDQSDKTGTGMGLTLAQRFLALMGGEISVESEVKKGTIFHITLPVEQVTEALFDSNRKKKLASLGQSDQDEDEDITADDLAVISDVLLAQLLDAVDALDTENSVALAELIEKKTPIIGKRLLTMINNFDFEKLQSLLNANQAK